MRHANLLFMMAILVPMLGFGCNTVRDEQNAGNGNGGGTGSVTVEGISLHWEVDGATLNVTVNAPTTGWVAVGFDPTSGMKDANFIIGYVDDGTVHIRDDYGTSRTGHGDDVGSGGEDNITNKSGTEAEGNTEISFTIPLDSGDSRDRALVVGNSYTVILGYGDNEADDLTSYHKKRTSANITL